MPQASEIAKSISCMHMTRDVLHALSSFIHGDTLDFGAGTARHKPMIAKYAARYTAFDLQAHPNIDIVGDVLAPPIGDASYDTVVSIHVLEHVREPWRMVEQMARILRPGGVAILMAPFMYPFHADPHDYFRFSEQGLSSLFERAGLRIELCSKYGGFFTVLSEVIKQKFLSHYRPRSWLKRRILFALEKIFTVLNTFFPPRIAYANVVCVARKTAS
jgi:SAM-dependent methyltransferase